MRAMNESGGSPRPENVPSEQSRGVREHGASAMHALSARSHRTSIVRN